MIYLNESNKLMVSDKLVELEFLEDKVTIKAYMKEEMINMSMYYYNNLFKVEETPTYFYIYIANNQALCIDKNDIDDNDEKQLQEILKSHINKYKVLKH